MAQINPLQLQKFKSLEFIAKQVVEGFITGLHKSPFHGFSVEFAEHRLYNKGESTKHIDWKLYGKTDKLFIKRFEEETNLRCQIVIDSSSSMYFPFSDKKDSISNNKISFSVYAAAALIELFKKQRDAVGLSVFSNKTEVYTTAKSSSLHHKMLFHELEKLLKPIDPKNQKKTFAVEALHQVAESIHKRSLIIIFSDMMDSEADTSKLFSALNHLKYNKHEVILFHVVDKSKEVEFNYDNRPYQFIDPESGEAVKLHPNEIKESYIASMSNYKKDLMLKCRQYKIDFIEANIDNGFEQILLPYLVKRGKMM